MSHRTDQCREVSRRGVVTAVNGALADIEIIQFSACSSCHIKALCSAGESSAKTVVAPNDGTLSPGMAVTLTMDERIGWLGVVVGFVLPLILVVTLLFGFRTVVAREEFAGLIAVGGLIPYYLLVYALRHYFARVVQFRVTRSEGAVETTPTRPLQFVEKEGVR